MTDMIDPFEDEWGQENHVLNDEEDYYDEDPDDENPEPEPPDFIQHTPRYMKWYEEEDVQTRSYHEESIYGEWSEQEAHEFEGASRVQSHYQGYKEDHGGGPWYARYPQPKPRGFYGREPCYARYPQPKQRGFYGREPCYAIYPHPMSEGGARLKESCGHGSSYGKLSPKPSYSPWRPTHHTPPRHDEEYTHLPKESTHTNVSISASLKDIQQLFEKAEHLIKSTIVKKGLGTKQDSDQTNSSNLRINEIPPKVLLPSVCKDPMKGMMHLPFAESVEIGTGHEGEQVSVPHVPQDKRSLEKKAPRLREMERMAEQREQVKSESKDQLKPLDQRLPELGVVPAATTTVQSEADQTGSRREEERPKEIPLDHAKNTKSVQQVSLSMTPIVSHDVTDVLKSLLNIHDHEETTFLKPAVENESAISSAKELGTISLPCPKEPMMHLFLAQKVNLIAGAKEVDHKEVPPQENLLLSKVQDQRTKEPMETISTSTKEAAAKSDHSRGVILSYLLKEKPPDVPSYAKPLAYPGKTLNSQRRMKANLLSVGTGQTVLRTKLSEGGGDDASIRSSPAKEHGKYTQELTKTLGQNQSGRTKDIGVFLGAYQPNQKDLSYESNCSRYYTHQGITERKNWIKSFPHDEDIQLTSWQTANDLKGDQRLLIEGLRSNQNEPSCKPTCFGNSTHQRRTENWIHAKITYGLKVIQLLNQERPDLPYLGAHGFKELQTYTWRPGEIYNHTGGSHNILPCTSSQRIRRILLTLHFPYLEPFAFKHQPRLSLLLMHDLEVFHTSQKVPRHHLYLPKLSRYKGHSKSC